MKKPLLILLSALLIAVIAKGQGNLIPYHCGKKWGYADTSGAIVLKPRFENCSFFSGELAVFKKRGKCGLIDSKGKIRVRPLFDLIGDYPGSGYYARIGKKDSCFNSQGKPINCPGQIIDGPSISRNMIGLPYKKNGKYGFYVFATRDSIPPIYESIQGMENGNLLVEKDGKWGVINEKRLIEIPMIYDLLESNWENTSCLIAGKDKCFGLIKNNGNIIIPLKYRAIEWPAGIVAYVHTFDGREGYVNFNGREYFCKK